MNATKKRTRWQRVADRIFNFVGGEIEYAVNGTVLRGPIKEIRLEADYLTLIPAWVASSPDQPEPDWRLEPNGARKFRFWLPSDNLSLPHQKRRRVRFSEGPVRVTLYPRGDKNKLNPDRFKGQPI